MAVTVEADGTQVASIGVEHTLHTDTDAKVYQLLVDTVNMALGDELELRAKLAVLLGGTRRQILLGAYKNMQADLIKISVPVSSPRDIEFTLKQVAGTGRSFPWSVVSV